MLKVIRFSILNMHELVEKWFWGFQKLFLWHWQSNVLFPWPNELTMCPDINGFQIPVKTSCTQDTDDIKQLRENLLGCRSFVLRHLCPVHKINAQTPIKTILATHLLHEFIVNVKYRTEWPCRKPCICLLFNFWKQYSANGTCSALENMQKYVTSRWLLWKSAIFPDLYWNSLTC